MEEVTGQNAGLCHEKAIGGQLSKNKGDPMDVNEMNDNWGEEDEYWGEWQCGDVDAIGKSKGKGFKGKGKGKRDIDVPGPMLQLRPSRTLGETLPAR